MRLAPFFAATAAASSFAMTAAAHIDLTYPPMRYEYSNNGQKTGPCGSGTPTNEKTTFAPGATITVTWDETVNHPGHFRISVDTSGNDAFVDPTDYDDFYVDDTVVLDNIVDNGGSSFSADITLPDIECDNCSLQLIQVMTDKPPWGPAGGNELYYWCADIAIEAGGSTGSGTSTQTSTGTGTGAGTGVDTGTGTGSSGGSGSGGSGSGSGSDSFGSGDDDGCAIGPGSATGSGGLALLLGLGALAVRRRRP